MGDGSVSLILDVHELADLAIAREKRIRKRQAEERYKRKSSGPTPAV